MKILIHEKALELAVEFIKDKKYFKPNEVREYYGKQGYTNYQTQIAGGNPRKHILRPINKVQMNAIMRKLSKLGYITKYSLRYWEVIK